MICYARCAKEEAFARHLDGFDWFFVYCKDTHEISQWADREDDQWPTKLIEFVRPVEGK